MLILLAMLFYIYPSISSTSLMYEYSSVTRDLSDIKELNKKMRLELSTLRSYDFIEKRAVNDLGFVFPAQGQVVIIAKK
jgi:cell division protein FtsB